MPATNPKRLKKSQLQKKLKEHGIKAPDSLLKTELVELYTSKVLHKKTSGFSSDEDEPVVRITRSTKKEFPQGGAKVQLQRIDDIVGTMAADGIDISELSDQQLGKELRMRGFDIGPIGPTTRRIYEKRLEKVLLSSGSGDAAVNGRQDYSDQDSAEDDYDDDDDVEVVETPMETRHKRRSLLRTQERDGSATRRRPMRVQVTEKDEEETILKEPVKKTPVPSKTKEVPTAEANGSWKKNLITLAVLVLLTVFLYFVYMAMESNPRRQISERQ